MSTSTSHRPVLLTASLSYLEPRTGLWYVDGTFGAGGHTRALLEAGACVLALDRDPQAKAFAKQLDSPCFRFFQGDFQQLESYLAAAGLPMVSGVLLDLGVSSMQLDLAERGFSFRREGPLDMRMSQQGESAAEVVNNYPMEQLAAIIYRYGEERYSRRIARRIVEARRQAAISTTTQLASIIATAYPPGRRRDHPARRTFQALRIHVNGELIALEQGLEAARRCLAPGGRLVVLSYHSLEDRIVKEFLRQAAGLKSLTDKPLAASEEEIAGNPRARSVKLRAAEKVTS